MFHPCLFFCAGRRGNTCQTLHQDRSCHYFEKGLVPKEFGYSKYNRNLVQLWVGLWCVRHDLWHQWLLSDSVTWQQRWTNLSKVDFGLWEANLDAECNLLKENWFWTLRLFLGCWFVLICSGVNDRQKGHTDEYTGENVLGTCFLFDLGKPSAIEVHKHFTRN